MGYYANIVINSKDSEFDDVKKTNEEIRQNDYYEDTFRVYDDGTVGVNDDYIDYSEEYMEELLKTLAKHMKSGFVEFHFSGEGGEFWAYKVVPGAVIDLENGSVVYEVEEKSDGANEVLLNALKQELEALRKKEKSILEKIKELSSDDGCRFEVRVPAVENRDVEFEYIVCFENRDDAEAFLEKVKNGKVDPSANFDEIEDIEVLGSSVSEIKSKEAYIRQEAG